MPPNSARGGTGVTKSASTLMAAWFGRVHREFFLEHPEKFDLRDPGKIFMADYAKFIAANNDYLGSSGQLPAVREFLKA